MTVKLLTEHHLEFLSLKGGCTSFSESTLVKYHIVGNHMPQLLSDYTGARASTCAIMLILAAPMVIYI